MKKLTLLLVIALSLLISSCAVEPGRHGYYYSPYDEYEGPIIFRHSLRNYGHSFHDDDHDRHHNRGYHRGYHRGDHHDNDHHYGHHDHDHDEE